MFSVNLAVLLLLLQNKSSTYSRYSYSSCSVYATGLVTAGVAVVVVVARNATKSVDTAIVVVVVVVEKCVLSVNRSISTLSVSLTICSSIYCLQKVHFVFPGQLTQVVHKARINFIFLADT